MPVGRVRLTEYRGADGKVLRRQWYRLCPKRNRWLPTTKARAARLVANGAPEEAVRVQSVN